ncbi:hypothetical protein FRC06_006856 [Ceratobasidium sp. 370]|nr:hypothetical protein FRC06_006856 [Ceratobasidium sp. 370]
MTSALSQSFSHAVIHSKGGVLPVKADSKSARRIRRKSMPSAPPSSRHHSKPAMPALLGSRIISDQQKHYQDQLVIEPRGQDRSIRPKKSTRSLRSVRRLGRMFRHEHPHDEKDKELVPPLPVPSLPTPTPPHTSSIGFTTSVRIPLTPPDSAVFVPGSGAMPEVTSGRPPAPVIDEMREGKVRGLWAKVTHGIKRMK